MSWRGWLSVGTLRWRSLPLRAQLALLLVAASLLPLILSASVAVRHSREQQLDATKNLLRAGADRIVNELDEFHRGRLQSVSRIARFPETTAFCMADAKRRADMLPSTAGLLATFPASDATIGGAALLDPRGHVLAASNPAIVGADLSGRPYVQSALRGDKTVSDIYMTLESLGEVPSIAYAAPMLAPGRRVACVAVLLVRATAIWQRIRASDALAGPGSFAVLFDERGIRIGHSYNDDIVFHPGGRLGPTEIEQLVAERRFGTRTRALLEDVRPFPQPFERARSADPDREVFLGFAPVNQAMNYGAARRFGTVRWTLFYMLPEATVQAQIDRQTGTQVALALGILAVAATLGVLFARGIVRPVIALDGAASTIAGGDLSARVRDIGGGELGRLAISFNTMVERIQSQADALRHSRDELEQRVSERTGELALSTERLRAQLERLRLLDQITTAIGEHQDLQSIYQVAVRSIEEQLPADFSCVCRYDALEGQLTVIRVGVHSAALVAELVMPENATVPIDENGLSRCVQGHLVYEADLGEVQPFAFPQRLLRGGLRSLVAAPLLAESQVFGVLVVARREPNGFESGEYEFLRQLSAHVGLAARQAELHTSLQRAYDDLKQSQQAVLQQEGLRALGQMASGIAHDINNAISPISLYTENLLEREPQLSSRGREQLQTIALAIDDVGATVARMREFYRQREPQAELQPVWLNELVRQVVELTRARWHDMPQQRGAVVALNIDLTPALSPVLAAESELREALINLVLNAVDAMPDGGTLTLRTHEPTGESIAVEIGDTGIGMDEATRRRCLEPFFTTKGERGTGLGLAMVYGIVQRHGGEIEIDSTLGRGTVVRIVLPSTQRASIGSTAPAAHVPVAPLRILVVDDDPIMLKTLSETLGQDGHAVTVATGGQAGIDAVRSARTTGRLFDVVITDLGMPHVDGHRVAAAVKEDAPSTPVIMLTGWGQRLTADGDVPAHVDQLLAKPPKLRTLRAALAHVVLRPRDRLAPDAQPVE